MTWYQDAIFYELHVRAFHDADGNGVGDFRGLTEKLDYVQSLGVNTLWLLPFYPSPLRDDGYDIADYRDVHPQYGTLADFKTFLTEAHRLGLRVVTELVLNHTSDQHAWFRRARRSPAGSPERDFYVWSDTPEKYREARVIFRDFEPSNWTYDPAARAYFWHRFYSHQPDLNIENPKVQKSLLEAVDFWMDLGVDGMRLDAVPYLFEREGTGCENLPETHAFLRKIRAHVDAKYKDRMLLAEANQWPEDAAAYFGGGDECHMAFHFPIMPRMFMAIHREDRFPLIDIVQQTPPIPAGCQWAIFLRNHDELTLEMVTDEERDYMYRAYAHDPQARINLGIRRRLAPLLGNNRRKIELMNSLLLSLPGTPVLYYGDEIGMGDNIFLGDRNGVRTPMQWSADRNAGFSRANAQRLYLPIGIDPEYHYEAVNVDAQDGNPHSLLWWMRRIVALRKKYRAFGRGSIEFLLPENFKVLAFVRKLGDEVILVVANLSRFVQFVELDLSAHAGARPVELFGQTPLPMVTDKPMCFTLGPHGFYWFALKRAPAESLAAAGPAVPAFQLEGNPEAVFDEVQRPALEDVLTVFLPRQRWFRGKSRIVKRVVVQDVVAVPKASGIVRLAVVEASYVEGEPEQYAVPMTILPAEGAEAPASGTVARLRCGGREFLLVDAVWDREFPAALLDAVTRGADFPGPGGALRGTGTPLLGEIRGTGPIEARVLGADQSNSSLVFGDRIILKLYRRLEPGVNPDLELSQFLTGPAGFRNTPAVAGWLEYLHDGTPPVHVGILQAYVPNQGDGWRYTLDELKNFYERVLASTPGEEAIAPEASPLDLSEQPLPAAVANLVGGYLESARLIGLRTAEMHAALAGPAAMENPELAPEPFNAHYQRSLYQGLRIDAARALHMLRGAQSRLHESLRPTALAVLDAEPHIMKLFQSVTGRRVRAGRIRVHGDYHLGQLLYTGKDFFIIDFEGEPSRPLSERRIKRSPLRDVAGMLRSFHYAAQAASSNVRAQGLVASERAPVLERWGRTWTSWVSSAFLRAYRERVAAARILPESRDEFAMLLDMYLMNKALYELTYELNHRPDWVGIPLQGVADLLWREKKA